MMEITAVVSIRIADITRLTHIFGEESTQQALTQFGEEATALLKRLLAQHQVVDQYRSDVDGHCSACFRVLSGGLPRDASEAAQAIEKAGRHLIRERLLAIFLAAGQAPGSTAICRCSFCLPKQSQEMPKQVGFNGRKIDRGPNRNINIRTGTTHRPE
ncbi:hypothetical protein OKW41_005074 [Paraburkholderia sp. UCT70]|uniref:hypothetical protein n=1 Tax=Paraburkholderia sp. UCT70 TaxID=2991068 RepID=UPI003D219DDC